MVSEGFSYYRSWFLACLIFLISGINALAGPNNYPTAKKGLLDLQTVDLSQNNIKLNGEWGFYWHQLINPNNQEPATRFTEFPKLWNNTIYDGNNLPAIGYASYSLTILLPKERKPLALVVPDVYASYQLFINGRLFSQNGHPDTSKERSNARWLAYTLPLDIHSDTLQLLLQVANYWHVKGGPYKNLVIGDRESLMFQDKTESALDLLLTGCLFMGGLFFFGLYLFGKHDKAILYFSLFCIFYSYRIIGTGDYELHGIFPTLPFWFTLHLEYLSLYAVVGFFTLYTWSLYPEDFGKKMLRSMLFICIGFAFITIALPSAIFTLLLNYFLLAMFLFIAYVLFVYIKAAKNKRVGSGYALWSTMAGLVINVIINLEYFGIIYPQKILVFLGYIIFFFLQSLILSFRFAFLLNKARIEAEQGLLAKSEFLSTMSHEIRTPLNSVIGLSNLLLRDNPRKDQEEYLKVMVFSANNLLSIVNNILDYNKIEAGKVSFELIEMNLVDISQNIITGFKAYAFERNNELIFNYDSSVKLDVLGDPTRTTQIIGNLLNNAIKFTKKGKITLSLKMVEMNNTSVKVEFRIADTGIGIDKDKQKHIFERFTQADSTTQRSFGGTGLGLAICKKLLNLQGAELLLESEPGQGSVFYFTQTFPLSKVQHALNPGLEELPTEESRPLKGISILLVEDNEVNILVAVSFLERWGATVDIARNGQEALEMLDIDTHKLILMDMHMPVMDGYTATKIIRERKLSIPIIALTASLPKEVERRIETVGMNDIVVKPFLPEELFKKVLHYTNVYRSPDLL